MIRFKFWPVALSALAFLVAGGFPARAQVEIDIIAVTGEFAHGGGGGQFKSFDRPALNDNGDIAFRATLYPGFRGITEDNNTGIWRKRPHTQVNKVARAGDYTSPFKPYGPQPEVTNARYGTLADPQIGPDGRVTFLSHLALPSESSFIGAHNNEMIFTMKALSAGVLDLAQEKGSKAPMVNYDSITGLQSILDREGKRTWFDHLHPPVVAADGAVVFSASLQMNGLDGKNGIWHFRPPEDQDPQTINPSFTVIQDIETEISGTTQHSFEEFSGLSLTAANTAVFHAKWDTGSPEEPTEGIWRQFGDGRPVPLTSIAISGQGARIQGIAQHTWNELGKPVASAHADLAFHTTLNNLLDPSRPPAYQEAIFFAPDDTYSDAIAHSGQRAPGFSWGNRFASFDDPAIAPDGTVAFVVRISNSGEPADSTGEAIYLKSKDRGLALIVRSGLPAPGMEGSTFLSFGTPLVNSTGQLAFSADVSPTPTHPRRHGFWMIGGNGVLDLVAGEGIPLPPPSGDGRIVKRIEGTAMNSSGQTAARIVFEDGAEAVALVSIANSQGNSFAAWAETRIPDPDSRSPSADPDGDGIINALERAYGGDPLAADPERVPVGAPPAIRYTDSPEIELVYRELSNPGNLRYEFESSSDLEEWTDTPIQETSRVLQPDGPYLVRVRRTIPDMESGGAYLRLRVSDP